MRVIHVRESITQLRENIFEFGAAPDSALSVEDSHGKFRAESKLHTRVDAACLWSPELAKILKLSCMTVGTNIIFSTLRSRAGSGFPGVVYKLYPQANL